MKKSDLLRNQEHPTVFGYELDRETLTPIRRYVGQTTKDWGADPINNGMFCMIPGGDIVDCAEKRRRLGQ